MLDLRQNTYSFEALTQRAILLGNVIANGQVRATVDALQQDRIDFRQTGTLLAHGDGVLAGIAQASRQLLSGVRLGDAGEVGRIAAAVIDEVITRALTTDESSAAILESAQHEIDTKGILFS